MTFHLEDNARRRAAARLAEIHAELVKIYRIFPELRRGRAGARASSAAVSQQRLGAWRRARMRKGWTGRRKPQTD